MPDAKTRCHIEIRQSWNEDTAARTAPTTAHRIVLMTHPPQTTPIFPPTLATLTTSHIAALSGLSAYLDLWSTSAAHREVCDDLSPRPVLTRLLEKDIERIIEMQGWAVLGDWLVRIMICLKAFGFHKGTENQKALWRAVRREAKRLGVGAEERAEG
ncbi:hypothetical protein BZA05DRAFT_421732 [Tricharina praecox]|uniref:uncharacterized protein n=1 Tax=Tricharina praecox TaxID=43433 RepID=UPI0022211A98|nr:uncharacterized protein BZA05DRAFT_421732 [Tricharina praecox]KAI5844805.1 hypothetical protein BZA05DRAFT_421732 [Tricharina praecox]